MTAVDTVCRLKAMPDVLFETASKSIFTGFQKIGLIQGVSQ